MATPRKAAATPKTDAERKAEWTEMQLSRIEPLETVTQEQLATIRDLQEKLKVAEAAARGAGETQRALVDARYERDLYRILIRGWPKGRKIIKALQRNPNDY